MRPHPGTKKLQAFDNRIIITFTLGLFIFVGFLSTTFLVSQSQDVRNQAMTDKGIVDVQTQVSPTKFVAGQLGKINLAMNTHSVPVTGFQFVLSLESPSLPTLMASNIRVIPNSGLELIYSNAVKTNNGYELQVAVRPAGPLNSSLTFSNAFFVNAIEISFTPQQAGTIHASFDPELTYTLDQNSDDVMNTIDPFVIEVSGANQQVPKNTIRPSVSPVVTSRYSNRKYYRRRITRFPWFKK